MLVDEVEHAVGQGSREADSEEVVRGLGRGEAAVLIDRHEHLPLSEREHATGVGLEDEAGRACGGEVPVRGEGEAIAVEGGDA